MKKTEIIEKIKQAFEGVEYPGDDKIVLDEPNADFTSTKEAFQGIKWEELEDGKLISFRNNLDCFSKEGLQYYLPAFMILVVKKFLKTDSLVDTIVQLLTLPDAADVQSLQDDIAKYDIFKGVNIDSEQYVERRQKSVGHEINAFHVQMTVFTREQSKAIRLFLTFLCENYLQEYFDDEPLVAINRYWYQFY